MDANAKCDTALGRVLALSSQDFLLQLDRAFDGIQRALEDREKSVAGVLHDFTAMRDDGRIGDFDRSVR